MDWDDEFDDNYDSDSAYDNTHSTFQRDEPTPDGSNARNGFDPRDIANPVSAYFFLSDDAQDEIDGSTRKRMKCRSCGKRFMGETYDSCPECFSINTEEILGIDDMDGSNGLGDVL